MTKLLLKKTHQSCLIENWESQETWGGDETIDSGEKHGGSYSAKLVASGSDVSSGESGKADISGMNIIEFICYTYLKSYTAGNYKIIIYFYDKDKVACSPTSSMTLLTLTAQESDWTEHKITKTVADDFPSDCRFISAKFLCDGTPTMTVYIDDIDFNQQESTTYFEPSETTIHILGKFEASNFTVTVPYDYQIFLADRITVYVDGTAKLGGTIEIIHRDRKRGIKELTILGNTRQLYDYWNTDEDHFEYEDQQDGVIIKDLIGYYMPFIDTTHVDNIDSVSHIDLSNMRLYDCLMELANRKDGMFYINKDNELYYFERGSVDSGETIESDQIINCESDEERISVVGKVKIAHKHGTYSMGAGMRTRYWYDRRWLDDDEAEEVATRIMDVYGDDRKSYTVYTKGFYDVEVGEKITVDSPDDGLNNELLEVNEIVWVFKSNTLHTIFQIGDEPTKLDKWLQQIIKEIQVQKRRRHSGKHQKSEKADTSDYDCSMACQSGCEVGHTCQETCQLECQATCQNVCQGGCETSCQTTCQTSCQGSCESTCQTGCEASCQGSCEASCQTACEASCQSSCETTCQTTCEIYCQTKCQFV